MIIQSDSLTWILQIDEGIDFYEEMLETLDSTYDIGLDNYYDVLEPRYEMKLVHLK